MCPQRLGLASVLVFYQGREWGREIKCSELLSLLSPMGPPQQSENNWLAALPPSLSWLLVFLFLPAPLLGAEREDGPQRPSHCSMAHPAASRPLSLAHRLWLVFHEVVRLSARSKPHPLPRPLVTSRGKLFMQPQKVTAGLCLIWEEGGVLQKTFFFSH